MIARAEAKYLRISPFKVMPIIPLVKGEKVQKAAAILHATNKKGAFLMSKILKSAISNAKNKGYEEGVLFISNIVANSGPVFKRYKSASFGRATMVRKRTSHIVIELDTGKKLINNVKNKVN